MRGILHEHEADMRNRLNAVDIVQVEVDAGIPSKRTPAPDVQAG
ncbi:MAG: hypothetical protein R2856_03140 [Caldilineaceae bacterium]